MTAEHIYTIIPDDPDDNNGGGGGGGQNDDPGGDGGVDDSPNNTNNGASQSQQNHEEAEWKQALAQAAHVAKQAGNLPGDLERMTVLSSTIFRRKARVPKNGLPITRFARALIIF